MDISVATGVSAYPTIRAMMDRVQEIMGIPVYVYAVKNLFFGDKVTVAGLITGQDIKNQLKDKKLGHSLLIPNTMLRRGEDVFLDGVTLEELSLSLGVPVIPVPVDGRELLEVISKAADIGEVITQPQGMVLIKTELGTERILAALEGEHVPRIC